ncbi:MULTISPECIES: hypothetical protein [unclassified Nocardiopsis]|nr:MULTISPECIES: hypothetical protein [unclassified Nocardiopsis]
MATINQRAPADHHRDRDLHPLPRFGQANPRGLPFTVCEAAVREDPPPA